MVNVIPPDHVDDVPVVEPNQHDDVPVVLEPILVDEDEDLEEDEFEEEEDPQEEEDDMEVDTKEDENEPELTYPYEEVDPLNPPLPVSESKPGDAIKVKNPIEHEDESIPASFHKVGESSTTPFFREDSDGLLSGLMRRDINSLFGRMTSLSRRLYGHETAHALVKKKGKAMDEYYDKLILELGDEVRSSMEIIPLKSAPMTKAAIRRMIKESVDGAIAAERARQANVKNDSSRVGPVRGQDAAPVVRVVELRRWFEKTESVFEISEYAEGKKVKFVAATLEGPALTWWKTKFATIGLETVNQMPLTKMKQLMTAEFCPIEERFNELSLMCPRIVEPERVKVDAYIRGLTDNSKGEVTSSKPADLNEAVRMAHKLMEQKSQARDARILEGKKRNQKQGNVQAMVTAPTDGKLPLCHTRNRCLKKIKQEEVGEVRGRAYAIKDAEPKGLNVVT
ncbi:hypothetical protein Tco_1443293, partial [Tanacetum coccineum]